MKTEKARLIKREDLKEEREELKPKAHTEVKARVAADLIVKGWIESRREQRQASAHARFAALFADSPAR